MGKSTSIQWCDSTVNPVMGCAGCELHTTNRSVCYAAHLHRLRSRHPGFAPNFNTPKLFPGRMAEAAKWSDLTGVIRPQKPWLNNQPRLTFVSDMGDALSERSAIDTDDLPVVGGAVPFDYLGSEVVDTVSSRAGERHRWLWLTKRPRRMADFSRWLRVERGMCVPSNLWAGTSVTGRATLNRVTELKSVGGADTVRFLSVEPLWEQISLSGMLDGISWVIVGGESRQGGPVRAFECDWARRLRDECGSSGVAFFVKQLGSNVNDQGRPVRCTDRHGGEWSEWPEDLRVRGMPAFLRPLVTQPRLSNADPWA